MAPQPEQALHLVGAPNRAWLLGSRWGEGPSPGHIAGGADGRSEASGLMVATMLRQQGAMRVVSAWESEVEV